MTEQALPFTDSRASQAEQILDFMLAGNRISPILALELFGCFRLGGRVYDLKKEKWNVITDIVHKNGKHFAEYWIDPNNPKLLS